VIHGGTRRIAFASPVVLALALLLAACTPAATPAPTADGSAAGLASPIEGVPVDIEAEGFTKVDAFTIRTDDGRQLRFVLGPLENPTEFPPQHLAEHLAGSTRIRVFFRPQGTDAVAYRLEDAPTP
jgi:hypothetical protein